MAGFAKRKYLFGTRAAGTLFNSASAGTSASKNIQSAVQGITGGVIFRQSGGTVTASGVLDIDIYDSEDGITFNKVGSFTQITAAGSNRKDLGFRVGPFVRIVTVLTSGTSIADVRIWVEYTESRESGRAAGGLTES